MEQQTIDELILSAKNPSLKIDQAMAAVHRAAYLLSENPSTYNHVLIAELLYYSRVMYLYHNDSDGAIDKMVMDIAKVEAGK